MDGAWDELLIRRVVRQIPHDEGSYSAGHFGFELTSGDERRVAIWNNNRIGSGKLTVPQYLELKQRSGGRCEICKTELKGKGAAGAHIDHDHITGKVRGLLCGRCNTSLERVEKDFKWGLRALAYLRREILEQKRVAGE